MTDVIDDLFSQRFKAPANGYVLERRAWLSSHSHIGICAFSAGAYLRQVLDDEVSRSAEQLLHCRSSRPEPKLKPGVLEYKALPCEHYAHDGAQTCSLRQRRHTWKPVRSALNSGRL